MCIRGSFGTTCLRGFYVQSLSSSARRIHLVTFRSFTEQHDEWCVFWNNKEHSFVNWKLRENEGNGAVLVNPDIRMFSCADVHFAREVTQWSEESNISCRWSLEHLYRLRTQFQLAKIKRVPFPLSATLAFIISRAHITIGREHLHFILPGGNWDFRLYESLQNSLVSNNYLRPLRQ